MAISEKEQEMLDMLTEPVSALDTPKKIKIFLYGEPGSWKTTTACRIGMDQGRVLHYAMNGDHVSYLDQFPDIAKNTDVIHHATGEMRQIDVIANRILEGGYPNHSTFVWDTVDTWLNLFLYEVVTKTRYVAGNGNSNSRTIIQPRIGKNIAGAQKFIDEMNLTATEQADYNIARIRLQPIVNKLCQASHRANMNVVINCHARIAEKDKIESDKHIRPNLPEQAYLNTVAEMDAVGYMDKNSAGIPVVNFIGGNAVSTKTRIGAINKKFTHPDKFVEAINAYLAG